MKLKLSLVIRAVQNLFFWLQLRADRLLLWIELVNLGFDYFWARQWIDRTLDYSTLVQLNRLLRSKQDAYIDNRFQLDQWSLVD